MARCTAGRDRAHHQVGSAGVEITGEELTTEMVFTLAEPFRRGTERTHSDQAGAGLGLVIVTSIVRAPEAHPPPHPARHRGLWVTVQLPAEPPRPGG